MSEFSDRPFVAGSVIGLRAFAVDRLARLVGPAYAQVFTPGENEAKCLRNEASLLFPRLTFTFDPSGGGLVGKAAPEPAEEAEETAEHTLAGLDCSCGFYAYYDGYNDYKQRDRVAAIIEGYGVCTVGERGFRASKARLVAIVRPGKAFSSEWLARFEHNYRGVPFYDRKRDALAAHPLTTPEVPTPETCDDFWTRGSL